MNDQLEAEQKVLAAQNDHLKSEREELQKITHELETKKQILESAEADIRDRTTAAREQLTQLTSSIDSTVESHKSLAASAFLSYCDTLDFAYEEKEKEYETLVTSLTASIQQEQAELDKIKSTRAAALKASLQEQEVRANINDYCLIPTASDLDDIKELERVKKLLHKPRILSMLIWQTYWQPLAKKQFPIILKDKTKCGIYKITNLQTNECYIGQSLDVYKRWNEHCKCGLGIDTPAGNKLYKSIQQYGLENFSFELIEECSKEELNEKEKYFIDFYSAKTFGFNGNEGNN